MITLPDPPARRRASLPFAVVCLSLGYLFHGTSVTELISPSAKLFPWVRVYHHDSPRYPSAPATPFDRAIQQAAEDTGLDPLLIKAVIAVESQFNVYDISPAGACGLMQLMPRTARLLAVKNIFDPEQNIQAGARHLHYLLRRFSNDLALSLAAYNAGERPVLRYKGIPPYSETQHYVKQVLKAYKTYQS